MSTPWQEADDEPCASASGLDPSGWPERDLRDVDPGGTLSGIRVLDLSRILSGPFCTMILADLGADVIKIENCDTGDDTRGWGPPFVGDEAAYFLAVNRNKRGIALDLKSTVGRQIARRLADGADVVVENFRPGTAARLGLGYEELSEEHPELVYASISGYGQTGPYRQRPGYDAIAQALSGVMSVTGEPDRHPVRVGVSSADLGAGMWATIGILAALQARRTTGRGQWVDISLLDGQVAWLTYVAGGMFASGQTPQRYGSAHPTIVPYQAFPTADADVMIAVGNDKLWRRFAEAIGLGTLVHDERFATNERRIANRDKLILMVEEVLTSRTAAEWTQALEAVGVPVAPVNTVEAALEHPQVVSRGMLVDLDHPGVGPIRTIGSPIKLNRQPPTFRQAPPMHGQHTDEVLAKLGLTTEEIDRLHSDGVVR